jgi:hypothetical protein
VDSRRSKTLSKAGVGFGEGEGLVLGHLCHILNVSFPSVMYLYILALAGSHLLFNITGNSLASFQKKMFRRRQ